MLFTGGERSAEDSAKRYELFLEVTMQELTAI